MRENKMKLKILAAGIAMAVAAPLAMAGTTDGFYVGAGVGFYNTDLTLKGGGASLSFGDDEHDAGLDVFAGYKWNFGAGSVSAELSYTDSYGKMATWSGGGESLSGKLKGKEAISILPGYQLSKDTTAFMRIGYAKAKGELTVAGTFNDTGSMNFNGILWGFGIEHALSPNLALRAEYKALDNMSETQNGATSEPRATGGNIALRYAF